MAELLPLTFCTENVVYQLPTKVYKVELYRNILVMTEHDFTLSELYIIHYNCKMIAHVMSYFNIYVVFFSYIFNSILVSGIFWRVFSNLFRRVAYWDMFINRKVSLVIHILIACFLLDWNVVHLTFLHSVCSENFMFSFGKCLTS